jgi:hypothetical protein
MILRAGRLLPAARKHLTGTTAFPARRGAVYTVAPITQIGGGNWMR